VAQLGIVFDIDELGGGVYGYAAYKVLFDAIDSSELQGCFLSDGDTNATLSGAANHYCIAIESFNASTLDRVREAVGSSRAPGLLPPSRRFLESAEVAREPLVQAAQVGPGGAIVGTSWIVKAREKSLEERKSRGAATPARATVGSPARKWWQVWKPLPAAPAALATAAVGAVAVVEAPPEARKATQDPRVVVGECPSCHRPLKTRTHAVRESMALTCKCGTVTRVAVPPEVLAACPGARSHSSASRSAPGAASPPVVPAEDLTILAELCDAYVRDDKAAIARLEPFATRIGEELNRRGGIGLMRQTWDCLGGRRGARTLEMHWSGIGEWLG
jgi:hypothetical protein